MQREGWVVTSACSDGKFVAPLRGQGYRIETLAISRGMNPFRHAVSILRMISLFRRGQFDIVHVHTPVAALLGRVAARLAGVRFVVYTAHGFYFHDEMRPLPRAAHVFLEWFGGRLTDLLFTQSAEDARTAVNRKFLPASRIVAIGNGVNPALFPEHDPERRARVRAALGVPGDSVLIGIIGRMVHEKGYGEFIDAAMQVAATRPDAWFIAIGDRLPSDHAGIIDEQVERACKVLGKRLILTGMRADVPDLLAAMDVFTLPSYREGMPRTIIEAMMSALPVVATNIRGSREEVVDGETGILVPARNAAALATALLRLIDDAALRARMGAAGRARALSQFDESKVVARQIAAIRAHLPAQQGALAR